MPGSGTSKMTLTARALVLRCPNCGSRGLFVNWFTMRERCPTCGLASERVPGHFVGAVGMNTIVTFGLLAVVLVAGFVITYPDVAVGPMLAIGLGTAVVFPLAFWPVSKTLWTAIDIMMRPVERNELDPRFQE
ncbi:MAG: DUF983 domain-containing protein [Actinomycetota bacterium]|nr:DUF983 domain-containing protein [Actinomycetota bacterium]